MKSALEDIPSTKLAGLHPLGYVALGAIFILLTLSFRTVDSGPSLSLVAQIQGASGVFSSDRLVAPETPELVFVDKTSLKASTPPVSVTPQVLGAIVGVVDVDIRPEVSRYIVEEGDTIASVAEEFSISAETVVWANELSRASTLRPGQELVILPTTGALHLVRPHDTLSEIAGWYQADADDIVDYNNLDSASAIFAGDFLIIPSGVMPSQLPQGRLTPLANSYFIYPIPSPHRITQGAHAFNAVDFSNGICGESVYAAAGGTVQRTGYTSLGGNYVRLLHPNGVVTYYGHLSGILVAPGTRLYQGETVGYTGQTGYATGCHTHFEVRGAANPFIP